ncbi:MAG: MerR family transcriptional regulator [Vulcanimicrobiaceae bacterium]
MNVFASRGGLAVAVPTHPSSNNGKLHIQLVSRLTSLTVDTIRAWEKRYQAVSPERGPAGQRRFSKDDVTRLVLLREAVAVGEPISKVAALSTTELRRLVQMERDVGDVVDATIARLLSYVRAFDIPRLAKELTTVGLTYPAVEFADDVISPLMAEISRTAHTLTEQMTRHAVLSETLSSIFGTLNAKYSADARKPLAIFLTLPGEKHAVSPILAALVATEAGRRGVFLGTEISPAHVEAIAHNIAACEIGIHVGSSSHQTLKAIRDLNRRLPQRVWVGGNGARNDSLLRVSQTMRQFATFLAETPFDIPDTAAAPRTLDPSLTAV